MKKIVFMALGLGSLVFIGCAEKNIAKVEVNKKLVKNNDNYTLVLNRSIKECATYDIVLDEQRTNDFMRRSPQSTIDKTATDTRKMPKKLCQFFAGETSLDKIKNVEAFTSKVMNACEKVGVTLPKEKIHDKITNLPFFVIKKGLAMKNETTVEKCELMAKKYK